MAHKGYTLNYFIDFFKNIPDHRWANGTLHEVGTARKCALGHCMTNSRTGKVEKGNARSLALQGFLRRQVVSINDGRGKYNELGATPRGRILKALRNRKRTGKVLS